MALKGSDEPQVTVRLPPRLYRGLKRYADKRGVGLIEAIERAVRGEDPELVARDLGVTAADLTGWRDDFLAAGEAALAAEPTDGRGFETARPDGGDEAGGSGKDGPAAATAPATVPEAAELVSEGTYWFMIPEPVLHHCLEVFEGSPPPLEGPWTPARERRAQRPALLVFSRDRVTVCARQGPVTIEKVIPTVGAVEGLPEDGTGSVEVVTDLNRLQRLVRIGKARRPGSRRPTPSSDGPLRVTYRPVGDNGTPSLRVKYPADGVSFGAYNGMPSPRVEYPSDGGSFGADIALAVLDPGDFPDHRSGLGACATPVQIEPDELRAGMNAVAVVARPDPEGSHTPFIHVLAGAVVGDGAGGAALRRAPGLAGVEVSVPAARRALDSIRRPLRQMSSDGTRLLDFPDHVQVSDDSTSVLWPKTGRSPPMLNGAAVDRLLDAPLECRAQFGREALLADLARLGVVRDRARGRRAGGGSPPRSSFPVPSWPPEADDGAWEEAEHDGLRLQIRLVGTSAAPGLLARIHSSVGWGSWTAPRRGSPDEAAGAAAGPPARLALQGMVDLATLERVLSELRGRTGEARGGAPPGRPTPDYLVLEDVVEDGGDDRHPLLPAAVAAAVAPRGRAAGRARAGRPAAGDDAPREVPVLRLEPPQRGGHPERGLLVTPSSRASVSDETG
jgi:hypothetical protein